MAKAIQIGGVLVAVTPFGREDRERCRELVRVMDAEWYGSRVAAADDTAEKEARIPVHRERVKANDPGREPVTCWGCGAVAPCSTFLGKHGWHTRRIWLRGKAIEVQCPDCYSQWGFIEPLTSEA